MRVVKARFRIAGKLHLFNAGDLDIHWRDKIVVEADRGIRLATAVGEVEEMEVETTEGEEELPRVLRIAGEEDLKKAKQMEEEEKSAYQIGLKKIANHKLNMKLVDVEFYLDRSKAIFYFVSETRVDFRALVRDLARTLRTRIEMRQIGVRDEVKIMGGVAPCGLQTCCSLFLDRFESISVKMLRDQNIMLNPVKYSGICGRLMCCLSYEQPVYVELKESFPPLGTEVETPEGRGEVVFQDVFKGMVTVKLDEGRELKFSVSDVSVVEEQEESCE